MNIPENLSKSCLLAALIFWLIIGSDDFESDMIPFIFLSLIPIFVCVMIVILGTICPIFWIASSTTFNNKQIFKTYFPYYTILTFTICLFGIIISNFDIYMIAFFTSAYITTNQSWVWFTKEKHK
ncbi:hypothetical protein [uncultured Psychroserpens sp.]|uniref:hypothetical protein n=1 Tax=uncultured Psychroserpens sp. TaxID=255436 RepID=UPI00262A0B41|nr:hypothetical protein [uncultured Psychroserpens sp.]